MGFRSNIFIDANVLLDVLLERNNSPSAESYLLNQATDSQLCISSLTAHLVVHFGSEFHKLSVIKNFLNDYQMLELGQVDFEWAFTNARNQDFEDALQLAVAIRHGCDIFITLDKKLHQTYKDIPQIKIHYIG